MKVLTFCVIVAMLYHVWVGMRDIWMDYVKPMGLRLVLQTFSPRLARGLRRLGHSGSVAPVSRVESQG
jgi:succinate dehydrogenase/fumarate reductase cytochrome b subunit